MAEIKPFKGILYNSKKVEPGLCVTPPYDVITPEEQERYYQFSPYNIIRIELGKDFPEDNDDENKYLRAARFLNDWLENGILKQDEQSFFYIYQQKYTLKSGEEKEKTGLIALVKLEEFEKKVILPHERTLSKPMEDRLNLIRATRANVSQIFSLFSDPSKEVDRILNKHIQLSSPLINFFDHENVNHLLWRITNSDDSKRLIELFKDKQIFIADGHHRYETSLKFRDEMREKSPSFTGKESWNYTMMTLVNMDNDLTIFPVHRIVKNLIYFCKSIFLNSVSNFFFMEKLNLSPTKESLPHLLEVIGNKKDEHTIGMYIKGEGFLLLKLKDLSLIEKFIHGDYPEEWKKLDVNILQFLIIENVLGLQAKEVEESVAFIKDEDKAFESVEKEEAQIAFFLNPVKISQIKTIALSGERMPQKSSFFYPKAWTGLVINKF